MHILSFGGMIPKVHPKNLGDKYSELAVDLNIYGGRFQPLPNLGEEVHVVGVDGIALKGEPASLHYVSGVWVGFPTFTAVAPDYSKKLGDDAFFFVQDNKLYRQSAQRVVAKKQPLLVGIDAPDCKVEPIARVLRGQGYKIGPSVFSCVPNMPQGCGTKVPFNTALCYTYANSCGEESRPSKPTNHIEYYDGDAVNVVVQDTPPSNAAVRRWYMAVAGNEGEAHWLYVGDNAVSQKEFIFNNIVGNIGEELDTLYDSAPPDCIDGVAAVGINQVAVWKGKHFWLSDPTRRHAFPQMAEYKLMYNILRLEEVTPAIEQGEHHVILAVTDGLHYIIRCNADEVHISEIETHAPALSRESICVAERSVFFASRLGLYEFTVNGVELLTGEFFTEREWSAYANKDTRLAYYEDKLHGVGVKDWVMNLSSDSRRDPSFVLTSDNATNVYAHHQGGLVYVTDVKDSTRARVRKFGIGDVDGYRRAVWQSAPIMMTGLWRPSSVKVVSSHFAHFSAGAQKAMQAFSAFNKRYPHKSVDVFVRENPEYKKYYVELARKRPHVYVTLLADGREYYKRPVYNNKPFFLPRKYRAIDWAVRVESNVPIDEIHIQTSREALLGRE